MFGCLVAGRLLQTNLVQVDETKATFSIPNPETINHLCVFLLGTVPFPDGYAATVHFHLPGKGFQLLGMLSNEKPSAIFRVKSVSQALVAEPSDTEAVIGVSIEPFQAVLAQVASLSSNQAALVVTHPPTILPSPSSRLADPTFLAQQIGKHLFNFLSSFAVSGMKGQGDSVVFSMADLNHWYEKLVMKIRNGGTAFLEREA
ncbi:DUF775-domain-containing protein [Cantharellus anzutake]|uniref:DUF775-domain-containing protein n=1 Tax=Cantharellus anzutake TaxID=1750568 RepID=UPI001903382B|nr:DUF775-domain-containing protein [Cantharellus anzutake]KAF8333037.1 DUF775-domain-containing protein [Cantharellus anzutake]